MNHYYEDNRNLESDIKQIVFNFRGMSFNFYTDNGVFSKKAVDYGSRVLLNNLELPKTKTVLEVGCGYGPIGIILKKIFLVDVTMVDVNKRALELCKKNIQLNEVDAKVLYSDVYENITNKYDFIISNPPIRAGKKVVYKIFDCKNYLNSSGELWIVIQKKQGAPSAIKEMKRLFGNCEIMGKDKGYYVLRSKKIA